MRNLKTLLKYRLFWLCCCSLV